MKGCSMHIPDELREAVKAAPKKEKSKTGEDQLSLFQAGLP
ncbi:hypothetical protein [Chitinophaga sp. GbtcB8]|nr:hypothetical protein [Chitinophaga sp. GbtcB8]